MLSELELVLVQMERTGSPYLEDIRRVVRGIREQERGVKRFRALAVEFLVPCSVHEDDVMDEISSVVGNSCNILEWRSTGPHSGFALTGPEAEDRFETELEYPGKEK